MPIENRKSILEQQLRRGEKRPSDWPWRLLLFSIIVFGLTFFIYIGVEFGYKTYLNSEIDSVEGDIKVLSNELDTERSQSVIKLYSKLLNINTLLVSHPVPTKLLTFIENNTDERVYYESLSVSIPERILLLEGVASDYASLARQIEIFSQKPEIKNISLEDSKTDKDEGSARTEVGFSLRLGVGQEIFK